MATLSKATTPQPAIKTAIDPTLPATATPSVVAGSNSALEYIAKVGEGTYKLSRGEILVAPIAPEVRCSTRRFSQARFLVLDENAALFSKLRLEADVTVSLGFQDGKVVEKFKGQIKHIGRVEPSCTLIVAIDNLAQLGKGAAAGTSDAGVVPPPDGRKADIDRSKRRVSKTVSYNKLEKTTLVKGSKLKDGTVYDPATLLVFTTSIPDRSTVTISIPGGTDFIDAIVTPGSAATNVKSIRVSEGLLTKASALPNKDKKPFKLEVYTLPAADPSAKTASTTEQTVLEQTKLKYSRQTPYAPNKDGSSTLQQTPGQKIVKDAAAVGNVVVAQGNTIKEISADQANQTKTNLILDYKFGKQAFFGDPIVTVKTPLAVNSGVGTLTVSGWNLNSKEAVTATAATQSEIITNLNFKSFAVPGGKLNLGDPIFPGCPYVWKDVIDRENGSPPAGSGLQHAIEIAQLITQLTEQTVGKGNKWQINSWYRTPAHNARISHTGLTGPHTHGSAVDFIFKPYEKCIELFRKLDTSHPYGVAYHPSLLQKNGLGFVHLDLISTPPRRRWTY